MRAARCAPRSARRRSGEPSPPKLLALHAHLDGCADCRAELRELDVGRTRAAARRSVARAPRDRTPPAGRAGEARPRPGRGRAHAPAARGRAAGSRVAAATATAIAAAVDRVRARGARTTRSSRRRRSCSRRRPGVSAARRTLRAHAAGTEVAFHVTGLDKGEYYWLWLTGDDGNRIAAGHVPRHRRADRCR